jgi:hypothetical protein
MKYYPMLLISGDSFSPSKASVKTGLSFEESEEPGSVSNRGRYRHVPRPFGSATLATSSTEFVALRHLLSVLCTHLSALKECGAEMISYYVVVGFDPREEQCNLEFDAEFIAGLNSSGVSLLISIDAESK